MENLLYILIEITSHWLFDVVVEHRHTGGFKVSCKNHIPSCCLSKLIDFCSFYHFDYYISATDNMVEFNITNL